MIRFAPDFTARLRTSSDASDVVAMRVTAVEGSPALNVSTVSAFQSTPIFSLMRSTTCCAVTVPPVVRAISGAVSTPVAASATHLRRERYMGSCFHPAKYNGGHTSAITINKTSASQHCELQPDARYIWTRSYE